MTQTNDIYFNDGQMNSNRRWYMKRNTIS